MLTKGITAVVTALTLTAVMASTALAQSSNYDLGPATESVTSQITSVLTDVLPIAGGIVALFLGWKILRRFVKA